MAAEDNNNFLPSCESINCIKHRGGMITIINPNDIKPDTENQLNRVLERYDTLIYYDINGIPFYENNYRTPIYYPNIVNDNEDLPIPNNIDNYNNITINPEDIRFDKHGIRLMTEPTLDIYKCPKSGSWCWKNNHGVYFYLNSVVPLELIPQCPYD